MKQEKEESFYRLNTETEEEELYKRTRRPARWSLVAGSVGSWRWCEEFEISGWLSLLDLSIRSEMLSELDAVAFLGVQKVTSLVKTPNRTERGTAKDGGEERGTGKDGGE